ncbi:D-glycero-beta-D-manno-heptose-7-phosphate kinase [Lichenibacterium dinghuense]|uniref:D-glycero-beta-D-manno-heptose-7-phosphate kinase n=1 Tax=Lichenibacterium dinghuense TaxID=2895977 RepID=UPI001F013F72|nr:D-glycero-beta-D-manno-heptose-7-phosphate kinase [Lichenibacterium sp. 6Y81]
MRHVFDGLARARVAVIGDLMLDVYLQGEVERISPEAPVPVVRLASERAVAGGAANVAANVAHLGGQVDLVGAAGPDEGFAALSRLLDAHGGIAQGGVVVDAACRTTRKTRLLGHNQQIARIDHEHRGPLPAAVDARVAERAAAAVAEADIAVLSDYGKGVVSDALLAAVFAAAAEAGKRVIVDPKRRDLGAYRGAAIVTPNRAELALATGHPCETDEDARAAAEIAIRQCGADILLTRSEKGMSYFPVDGEPIHLPTVAQEVFDVSGAGDTVVGTLALCLAAGLPIAEAMRAANHAAGIVVGKVGTALVSREELLADLMADGGADVEDGRLMDREALVAQRAWWRRQGLSVGFTNGCFDLVHPGHASLIRQAAAGCDRLVMALNTDASVRRLKGPSRPLQGEAARAEVVGALKGVAAVVLFDEDTPLELISALQPDLLVKGADYTEDTVVGADVVKAGGGRVMLARLVPGQSTTRLAARGAAVAAPAAGTAA